MDGHHFDVIVRTLSERGSRRGAARLLGAAVALLAGSQAQTTLAKGKGKGGGKGKGKKSDCPKKKCPKGRHRNKRTCECECTRLPCSGGMEFDVDKCRCKCPSDMRECRDGCVARDGCCPGDPPCPGDAKGCCHAPGLDVCLSDGCCRELDGMRACGDLCVDTNTHPGHCGACNHTCDIGERCVDGQCVSCEDGLTAQGQCCPSGKFSCGDACCDMTTETCSDDGCCPLGGGHSVCDGKCVDTKTDKRHCGRCGWTCDFPGFGCCNGSCTNFQNDEENCGACGNACNPLSEVCVEGACREICSLNQPPWQNPCDDGVDHWCCPDGSTTCCRLSGRPHCC